MYTVFHRCITYTEYYSTKKAAVNTLQRTTRQLLAKRQAQRERHSIEEAATTTIQVAIYILYMLFVHIIDLCTQCTATSCAVQHTAYTNLIKLYAYMLVIADTVNDVCEVYTRCSAEPSISTALCAGLP
jgi:hypothetical protein